MRENRLIRIAYFTDNGNAVCQKLKDAFCDYLFEAKPKEQTLSDFTEDSFKYHLPIVFVGATGIAVRAIAPFVASKLTDSPVIVIDELGLNVIPILSGHYGGANELAKEFSKALGANAVITTATDVNNVFAIDCFAAQNGFRIADKSKIKGVSEKLLKGERILVRNDVADLEFASEIPTNLILEDKAEADVIISESEVDTGLCLIPKRLVIGMGCKKDKAFEELLDFLKESFSEEELKQQLYAICSIDVKSKEVGLLKLAAYLGAKYFTFSAEELEAVEGDFEESEFVSKQVGVGNVSERAALAIDAVLVSNKEAKCGMTKAVAKRDLRSIKWLD